MHRILVVANETCPCPALLEEVRDRAVAHEQHEVRIIAPALNSRVRHYLSDVDGAVAAARGRLEGALEFLRSEGVGADALHESPANEVLVTHLVSEYGAVPA